VEVFIVVFIWFLEAFWPRLIIKPQILKKVALLFTNELSQGPESA